MAALSETRSEARIIRLDGARRAGSASREPRKPAYSRRRLGAARALVAIGCLAGTGFGLSALLIDLTIVYEGFGSEALTLRLPSAP
jgi:hypothetical protein